MADERDARWDRMVLRLPKGIKPLIEERVYENCNSLNGELVHLIKRGLAAEAASEPSRQTQL